LLEAHPAEALRLAAALDALEALHAAAPAVRRSHDDAPGAEVMSHAAMTDYHIVRELGRGGMGVVYEAREKSLDRRVALKVLPFAAALDPRSLARFRQESLAAAQLDHPHIVRVYGVGCDRGVHYYAMQYIEGPSLAQVIGDMRLHRTDGAPAPGAALPETVAGCAANLSTERITNRREYYRAVARLAAQVAEALEYAHTHGILHRDIKPGNLLLDAAGSAWVTDFGLARIDNDVGLTLTGDVLGTLRYMSPEQSRARRGLVDQRTDIYSLGATLYEMLTLEPAYATEDRGELLRQIAYEDPRPLRQIDRTIPREFETIVLKALEKDPADRYATAIDLALDLQRFLDDQPLAARRATPLERMVKWSRRHRSLVASLTVSMVLSLIGLAIVAVIFGWNQRRLATDRAGMIHRALLDNSEALTTARAANYRDEVWAKLKSARDLDVPDHRLERVKALALACLGDPFGIGANPGAEFTRRPPRDIAGSFRLREQVLELPAGMPRPYSVSDDGVWFAVVGSEIELLNNEGQWHPTPLRLGHVHALEFSPSGRFLAAACEEGAAVWTVPELVPELVVRGDVVRSLAFHPTGQLLALLNRELRLELWSLASHRLMHSLTVPAETQKIEFSLDGNYLLAIAGDRVAAAYSITTTPEKRYLLGHTGAATAVDFTPDGELIASVSKDRTARLWEAGNGKLRHTLIGHQREIQDAAFSPDGKWVATGDWDGTILIWDVESGTRAARIDAAGVAGQIWRLKFDPQGRYLAASGGRGVGAWSMAVSTGNLAPMRLFVVKHNTTVYDLAIHPDGGQIAFLDSASQCWTWRLATPDPPRALAISSRLDFPSLTFDAAGRGLTYITREQAVALWDWEAATGGQVTSRRFNGGTMARLARTRDGGRLAVVAPANQIVIYDLAADRELAQLPPERAEVWTLNWSADGARLVIGLSDGTVAIWDLEKVRSALAELKIELPPMAFGRASPAHAAAGTPAILSPHELSRLASAALGQQLRELRNQAEQAVLSGQLLAVDGVASQAVRLAESSRIHHRFSEDSQLEFLRTLSDVGFRFSSARFGPSAERVFRASIAAMPAGASDSSVSAPLRAEQARNFWGLGHCREMQERRLDATTLYRWALELLESPDVEHPPDRELIEMGLAIGFDLGRALAASSQADEAERVLRKSVENWDALAVREPSQTSDLRIRVGCRLAELCTRNGRDDIAEADLRNVLGLQPDDAAASNALAWLLVNRPGGAARSQIAEAVAWAEKGVKGAADQGPHWNTLGAARFRAGDWQAAVRALKKSRGLNRSQNFAHDGFLLAMCEWRLGEHDQARTWHSASCRWMDQFSPHDEELAAFQRESAALLEMADPETGIVRNKDDTDEILLFSQIIEADPEAGWAVIERARREIERGDQASAAADLKRAADLPGATLDDWQALATGFQRVELWSDAIAAQEHLLGVVPDSDRALNDLAWLLATCPKPELQDVRRAVKLATRATGSSPADGMYWNTLGAAQYRLGEWDAARTSLTNSVSLLHDLSFAHNAYFMALVVDRLGDRSLAEKWYAAATAWAARFSAGDREIARFAREAAQALALPDAAPPLDPTNVPPEPDVYTTIAAVLPCPAWVLCRRSELHAALGDKTAALADLSAALELAAYDPIGLLDVVSIANRLADWKLVVRATRDSSARQSENGVRVPYRARGCARTEFVPIGPWLNELLLPYRARARAELGLWDEALADLTDMIELAPDNNDLLTCQAIVNLEAGNLSAYRSMRQTLIEQLAARPLPGDAAPLVSTLLAVSPSDREIAPLAALAERALAASPENARVLGAALLRSGKNAAAVECIERAVDATALSARDHYFLALAHHGLDQRDLAGVHLEKGTEAMASVPRAIPENSGSGVLAEWFARIADEHLRREAESIVGTVR
jgi:serine/threonine protein kinase/WD40 repeat protein/Tfp pilus assembly protein PilF